LACLFADGGRRVTKGSSEVATVPRWLIRLSPG
jgi:hypothetical protein